MAGGYFHQPPAEEGVARLLKEQQAQLDALRSGAGIRSSILRGAELIFQTEAGVTLGQWGTFARAQLVGNERVTDIAEGAIFLHPDGTTLFTAVHYPSNGGTEIKGEADFVDFRGDRMVLVSPSMELYSLPSTGSAANLHLSSPTPVLMFVTSARKYKEDIAEAEVDVEDVLAISGRTWVDKGEIDRNEPGDLRRNVGFIADELDEYPSLRQFVRYKDGEPDAIEYDRLSVALLAVIKDQQARIDDHEERLTRLEGGGQ